MPTYLSMYRQPKLLANPGEMSIYIQKPAGIIAYITLNNPLT